MKYTYKRQREVLYSETDRELSLGVIGCFDITQDMITAFFETIGSDNYTLFTKDKALWVVTKTRIRFYSKPAWNSKLHCVSSITSLQKLRLNLLTTVTGEKGDPVFEAFQECCPIDADARTVRKIESVSFPGDAEPDLPEGMPARPFSPLTADLSGFERAGSRTVRLSDLDFSNHANNVSYVRYILDTLDSRKVQGDLVTDFEIHYLSESRESDELEIYRKESAGEDFADFAILNNGAVCTRARVRKTANGK